MWASQDEIVWRSGARRSLAFPPTPLAAVRRRMRTHALSLEDEELRDKLEEGERMVEDERSSDSRKRRRRD